MSDATAKLSIDKWSWAARFFKTRSMASDAIAKNRVRVDGQRIKASRTISVGNRVQIEKPPYEFDVTVLGLSDQRRGAKEAVLLYQETDDSVERRAVLSARLRNDRMARLGVAGAGRPSKRQRRQIIRFQNQNDVDE